MMKYSVLVLATLALSACATTTGQPSGPIKVNPASIAANPTAYNGREVEVVGLVVNEFEHHELAQSYGAYCRGADNSAISVHWDNWPGVTKADNRRMVMVRGTFHFVEGTTQAPGTLVVSGSAPGPLDPGAVVNWLSSPAKPCPRALP